MRTGVPSSDRNAVDAARAGRAVPAPLLCLPAPPCVPTPPTGGTGTALLTGTAVAPVSVAGAPDPVAPETDAYAPADRHPVRVYLTSLALGSRRTMRQALDVIARLLSPLAARTGAMDLPWHELGYQHVAAVRARLAATYAPTTANKILAALKGVVRQAFALGLMGAEACSRILMVKSVRGSRVPKGRSVSQLELRELFAICDAGTAGGARDAALLGVAYGTGLRRSELVGLNLADFSRRTGVLIVRGKGNKERVAYVTHGARNALETWLELRGAAPGALFHPVNKAGRITRARMTDQAVYMLLRRLATKAKVGAFSPHDLRRTFIGDLLDAGADIATVAALCAHATIATTMKYDRRGERTKRRAAEMLSVPFEG